MLLETNDRLHFPAPFSLQYEWPKCLCFGAQAESTEDDTALNQAEVVQEAPKPPPRIRTPEEIAAGLERQKAAVNAIRNTPEKRAATRALAPTEIPPATTTSAYSTAPVDRSGANRAPADRSGGKFKNMFKGKGPSIPGFRSKRGSSSPSENNVVSSAPVEVAPERDDGSSGNSGDALGTDTTTSFSAPETKKGGKFRGIFKRGSSKTKIASPARDLPARSSSGQAGVPYEVELSEQAELSDEPVPSDASAASYSEPAPPLHMQQQQQQLPAAYSGMFFLLFVDDVLPCFQWNPKLSPSIVIASSSFPSELLTTHHTSCAPTLALLSRCPHSVRNPFLRLETMPATTCFIIYYITYYELLCFFIYGLVGSCRHSNPGVRSSSAADC